MPTLYEVFFWVGIIITVATLWVVSSKSETDLYVSEYELDRLNGDKY